MNVIGHNDTAHDEPEGDAKTIGQRLAGELVNELLPLQPRRVLTAEGALWGTVKPELRQLLALIEGARATDRAQLLVSGQHLRDPFVMAFMGQLDRADLDYQVVPSTLSEIQALYKVETASGVVTIAVDGTSRQQEVIRLLGAAHARGASDVHFVVGR
ncbi:pilus assembly protein PilQ, partial [Pseudomonas oryzihabitans]